VPEAREDVASACAGLEPRTDLLIEHLHRLQDALGGLRPSRIAALAAHLRLSQAEVYEVASFYHHFHLLAEDEAAPRVVVRVCTSLPCQMAGGANLVEGVRRSLADDPSVRVVEAPCIGQCHVAPAACVGQQQVGGADVDSLVRVVGQSAWPPRQPPRAQARPVNPYAQWERLMAGAWMPAQVIAELKTSGLRGLGGAGFPAWRKWETVMAQPGPRHLVVNIDEGEVGTFKDWSVLVDSPEQVLEGALIAAYVVGARQVWMYLRDEYHDARQVLTQAVADLEHRIEGWRVQHPELAWPTINLRRGAGAYVCGEESALIESLEGKRGLPRLKPPIVAIRGLFGQPTLAHNLETLWWLPLLLENGGAWWAAQGVRGRVGLRRYSVSGRVRTPGVYLAPAGTTLRELVEEHAGGMLPGHELYAFLPGGASGGILPAALADVPLDFDTLAEHGAFVGSMAVVVLGHQDKVRDAALSLMGFFKHESCGQCTPCRAGTAQAEALMQALRWDADTLADLSQVMREASICGLGQAAPNPFDAVLRHFPHEVL
jgi:formate dehydrogenase